MKSLYSTLLALFLLLLFTRCDNEQPSVLCDNTVLATAKDLTGLDGCGFVFELADGSRLEAQMPINNFQWADGKQVRITFEEITDGVSICMVGKIVKITCWEEVTSK